MLLLESNDGYKLDDDMWHDYDIHMNKYGVDFIYLFLILLLVIYPKWLKHSDLLNILIIQANDVLWL